MASVHARLVECVKSEEMWLWRTVAAIIEWPSSWRITRIALSRIRLNRWRLRLKSLGQGSTIYPSVVIHSPENVAVGHNVSLVEFVHIWGGGGVTIGDNTMIASHTVITSQTHGKIADTRRENVCAPVTIGRNVWVGAGAIILPGVTIGENAIIAAGAVVAKDVDSNRIVAGIPAQTVQTIPTLTNGG